jgi:hypothetical protein
MLPKCGNSNEKERRQLLGRYLSLFGKDSIECIMGDPEFTGYDWFRYMIKKKIPFYMRIKGNMWIAISREFSVQAFSLFNRHGYNRAYFYPRRVSINGNKVYLPGMKILNKDGKEEYVIIASLHPDHHALERYRDRWQIETMFKGLKSSGFNMEDTHLTDLSRLSKMMALLSVAYVWAYRVGIYCHNHIKPIIIKKHGRKAYSFFKYGLKYIAHALLNPFVVMDFEICTKVLSCT